MRALTGTAPRWWRPPHGIPTARLGMRPVRGVDGHEWRHDATAPSVAERLIRTLRPGATVLRHDANTASPPGTARLAHTALPDLVAEVRRRGWTIGPPGEYVSRAPRRAA